MRRWLGCFVKLTYLMRIGLDGIPLVFPKTGVGHYTFELAQALARVSANDEFQLLYPSTFAAIEDQNSALPANLVIKRVEVGTLGRHWWSIGLPRYIRRHGIQLFHGTNYDVPLWHRCATVLSIHDLSLLLHSSTHRRRSVLRARRRLPLMLKTTDAVITGAESVRTEIASTLGHASKINVVPDAVRACFSPMKTEDSQVIRERLHIGSTFILAVGTIEPRKNLKVLIKGFEQLTQTSADRDLQLVIAGGRGWLSGPLFEAVKSSTMRDRIVLTDYLEDEELRALYSSCSVFVYPSLYEGFGLPPLEAMACGAAVVVSDIPVLKETTGGAASLIDPQSPSELADKVSRLLTDKNERQGLVTAGLRWSSQFSWERTARETLAVYRRTVQ